MTGSLACHRLKVDPIAALASVTRNPATTLPVRDNVVHGVIAEGAIANFNQLKSEIVESWCQSFGHSAISKTWTHSE